MRGKGLLLRISGRTTARRLDQMGERLDRVATRSRKTHRTVRAIAKDTEFHVREVNRISPQLAALEAKVEDLRQLLERSPRVDSVEEVSHGRTLVEEIQQEHARIRVRLSAVTTYEERLRRIEEKLGLPHD